MNIHIYKVGQMFDPPHYFENAPKCWKMVKHEFNQFEGTSFWFKNLSLGVRDI